MITINYLFPRFDEGKCEICIWSCRHCRYCVSCDNNLIKATCQQRDSQINHVVN